jgi:predicted ATPase/class 3 adenylate cyclase
VLAAQPSGEVCFLFTDVEGSTRLWAEHTATMETALARHDELLLETITAHDGYVFSTGGDGVGAAFATVPDAVEAAVAAQRALHGEAWTGLPAPLRVRMGLHRGAAQERAKNYFGPAVNLAARVMSAAWGGQILCTASVADEDVAEFEALGEHRLRDIGDVIALFQIVVPAVPARFPSPRTLDRSPSTLPAQRSTFLGRHDEIARARRALLEHRLVTFTGPGGVGKSRLAIEVAGREHPRWPDGSFFVDLTTVDGRVDIAATVATACLVDVDATRPPLQQLTATLTGRECLIVFDSCEHVLEPIAEVIDRLLEDCPAVKVIATSREAIGLSGEQVEIVGSLESAAGAPAAVLFVERAAAVGSAFEVDDPGVGALCARLDGIPLAIELAAARTRTLGVGDIAARVAQGLDLLASKRRGGHDRHRTLRATIEWSYRLLEDEERALFDRCSVFAGSFDLAALTAVGGLDDDETAELLDDLVVKSMVVALADGNGPRRFRLLDTLRSFAREQLELHPGDEEDARDAHALHYLARLGALPPWRNIARDLRDEFEQDLGNILVAVDRVDETGSAALARSRGVTDPLVFLLTNLGLFDEARARCDLALAANLDDASRGRLLVASAYVEATQDGTSDFAAIAREALAYLTPGDGVWSAALGMTSIVAQMFAPDFAVPELEAALSRLDGTSSVAAAHDRAVIGFYLGGALMSARDHERAAALQLEAARVLDTIEPTSLVRLWTASGAAMSLTLLGRLEEATNALDEVAMLSGWTDWSVDWYFARAFLAARRGDMSAARRELAAIGTRFDNGSVSPMTGTVLAGFGVLAYLRGEHERAVAMLDIVTSTRATASTAVLYEVIGDAEGWRGIDYSNRRIERALAALQKQQQLDRSVFFTELATRLHEALRDPDPDGG